MGISQGSTARARSWLLGASLVVLVGGLLALVTHGDKAVSRPSPAEAAQPAVPAAAAPAAHDPAPSPGDWNLLTPPDEFLVIDDSRARTGRLGLEDVARLDAVDPEAARARFTELGFTGARSRAWQSPTDALLVVAYAFADERAAATYVGEATALRLADPGAAPVPLTGVPGASAFRLDVPGDPTQVAFLSRGTHAYLVGLVGPAAADPSAALLGRVAALQHEAAL